MKLVASQRIARYPLDIAYRPGGVVVVLSSATEETLCEAYNADLSPAWIVYPEEPAVALLTASDGTLWILDATGALALGEQGVQLARVNAHIPEEMSLSAFAQFENGFIFVCQHTKYTSNRAPMIQRVDSDGELCWSTLLPVKPVAYHGLVEMRADEGWEMRPKDPWTPRSWLSTSKILTLSGDAVLACFNDPSSGIGFGYIVSLADGSLRFTTKMGPLQEVAALSDGAFLVGYQGYGAFETLHYERDGSVKQQWPSHGYYVIQGEDVRVIEMENSLPSKMHLARLLAGGTVKKGAWLDGYYTSRPFVRPDGTLCFFRNGEVQAARDLSIDERLVLFSPDDRAYSTKIVGSDQSLYFVSVQHTEGMEFDARLFRVEL